MGMGKQTDTETTFEPHPTSSNRNIKIIPQRPQHKNCRIKAPYKYILNLVVNNVKNCRIKAPYSVKDSALIGGRTVYLLVVPEASRSSSWHTC